MNSCQLKKWSFESRQWAIKMRLNTLANRFSTLANWTLAKRLVRETTDIRSAWSRVSALLRLLTQGQVTFFDERWVNKKVLAINDHGTHFVNRLNLHVCLLKPFCSGSRDELSKEKYLKLLPPISIIVVKVSSCHLNLLLKKKKKFPSLYSCTSVCPSLLAQHANDDLFSIRKIGCS